MTISVRIPEETLRRLDALAERTHRSRAFHLREAIERGLPQVEREYHTAQRADEARSGAVATETLAKVVAELGLAPFSGTQTTPGHRA